MKRALSLALTGAALLLAPAAAPGQVRAAAGVSPDTVTVGDRFRVVVRLSTPPGTRVDFPGRLDPTAEVNVLGAPRVRPAPGGREHTAEYRMVAWRTGELRLPALSARVTPPGGSAGTVRVPLPAPIVRSVLPADTAGVTPRGPKDVLDAPRPPWLLAALLVALALLLAALARRLLRRRRGPRAPLPVSVPDARAHALAELERARRLGLVERGAWKELYARTSGALRGFLAALSPEWGEDLTTGELVRRMGGEDAGEVERLEGLLREADLVKFARVVPGREEAERHWAGARAWVEQFQPGGAAAAEPVTAEAAT
jgi:hypothetical protein